MINGKLFSSSSAKLQHTTKCFACGLYKNCKSPKLTPVGNNKKNILVIRGVPTSSDEEFNESFTGDSYDLLYPIFKENGIDLFEDCRLMSVIACHANTFKYPKEIGRALDYCYPNIHKEIVQSKPQLIILAGFDAVMGFIKRKHPKKMIDIYKWRGWTIPDQEYKAWVCPIFDPHDLGRLTGKDGTKNKNLFKTHEVVWKQDIKRALSCLDVGCPDYSSLKKQCCILNEKDALLWIDNAKKEIKDMVLKGVKVYFVFDLETNRLKYHNKGASIFSIAISYKDRESASFRWSPLIAKALKPLFTTNKIVHVAHNMKFEDGWVSIDGIVLGNPSFDTMIAAHILDNRKNITSLKFQAYVNFGVADYNSHIEQWLIGPSSYEDNLIYKSPVKEMLTYDAEDALYTRMLLMKQLRELGYDVNDNDL